MEDADAGAAAASAAVAGAAAAAAFPPPSSDEEPPLAAAAASAPKPPDAAAAPKLSAGASLLPPPSPSVFAAVPPLARAPKPFAAVAAAVPTENGFDAPEPESAAKPPKLMPDLKLNAPSAGAAVVSVAVVRARLVCGASSRSSSDSPMVRLQTTLLDRAISSSMTISRRK